MIEIYNEKVKDLLMPQSKRPITGLKIRESKILGIFIEGLIKYPVMSYKEISDKMDEGYEKSYNSLNSNECNKFSFT